MNFILSPLMYYFTRHAFLYFVTVLSILCLIASISELVEYSKQMPNLVDNSFYICLKMTLYKLPINIQNLLPYSFYFGSIMSLLKLSKNSELTIARASGLNIWYCCLPHIILAFLIASRTASIGPKPIKDGSTPTEDHDTIFTNGFIDFFSASSNEVNNKAAAPSLIPEELPGVIVPLS